MKYITKEEAKEAGFSSFNDCPHLCVDVPDGKSTITARTKDGRRITFAFLDYGQETPQCVDIKYHDNGTTNENGVSTMNVIVFAQGPKLYANKPGELMPTLATILLHQ